MATNLNALEGKNKPDVSRVQEGTIGQSPIVGTHEPSLQTIWVHAAPRAKQPHIEEHFKF